MSLRDLASEMVKTRTISEGAALLLTAGREIGLPWVAAVSDVSRAELDCDEQGCRLADGVFGWPKLLAQTWADKRYTLGNLIYLRSRFEALPYVWMISDGARRTGGNAKDRAIDREFRAIGLTGAIAVPVRHTLGRLGGVRWWGGQTRAELRDILSKHGPDLLVLAHYFIGMQASRQCDAGFEAATASLTEREVECLSLVASGRSDAEAANDLGVSLHTVRFHIDNAIAKLGATTRSHAIALAAQLGAIDKVI